MLLEPFNADERAAQVLAGGGARLAPIRGKMPEQHRAFFEALTYAALGTLDEAGWPRATLVTGTAGFIRAQDASTLVMSDVAEGVAGRVGEVAGLLGIDFATRRRNRANGVIAERGPEGLVLRVAESFGNCPKYIQRREVLPAVRVAGAVEEVAGLDSEARALIAAADTVFVASRARMGIGGVAGVDISHRGGRGGFVRAEGERLTIPDFEGNRYYNTLGNLLGDGRAALLFVDFERGDLLELQGVVEIDWSGVAAGWFTGARRSWGFSTVRGWRRRGVVPLRWSEAEMSPFLEATGEWA